MSGNQTQGINHEPSRKDDGAVDLSASLTSRAAAGTVIRVDKTPIFSLSSGRGNHPVDLDRPFVSLTSEHSDNYYRGNLVYPIGDEGGVAGAHRSQGYVTVTSLNVSRANFLGMEIGKSVIALKDLIESSGTHTGISAELKGKNVKFYLKGKTIGQADAVETLLEHFTMLRIPEGVRTAGITSKLGAQEQTKYESGIICESLDEVAYLLKGYDSGSIRSSRATKDRLMDDVGAEHDGLGVGFLAVAMKSLASGQASLVDRLIAEISEAAKAGRVFSKDYDYDGMGSAFFKTSVTVKPVDGKFILGINAAYVGDKPEGELAVAANKDRALHYVGAKYPLTQVVKNFVSVDLGAALTGTEFNPELIAKTAAGELDRYTSEKATVKGKLGKYSVSVGLGQVDNYRADVFRAKGTGLFMNLEGDKGEPYLVVSVRMAGDQEVAISKGQKAEMTEIRDRLATLISQAHS